MHDGVNRQGQDLYPVMPYTFYTKVTREDVAAIFAYLRTLPPVRNAIDVDQLRFPFDIRLTQLFWRELFFTAGTFAPEPAQSAEWNRGAYLVEGLGHCGACHSPRDALGGIRPNEQLTGARIDHWFALNLTSDLRAGIGGWSDDQIVAFLKSGAAKGKSTALGPMAEVVHNSLGHLTDDDLRAMAVYLKSVPAKAAPVDGGNDTAGPPPRNALLYVQNCAGCHQAKGTGIAGTFPPLAGNPVVLAPDPGRRAVRRARRCPVARRLHDDAVLRGRPERPGDRRRGQLRPRQLGQRTASAGDRGRSRGDARQRRCTDESAQAADSGTGTEFDRAGRRRLVHGGAGRCGRPGFRAELRRLSRRRSARRRRPGPGWRHVPGQMGPAHGRRPQRLRARADAALQPGLALAAAIRCHHRLHSSR